MYLCLPFSVDFLANPLSYRSETTATKVMSSNCIRNRTGEFVSSYRLLQAKFYSIRWGAVNKLNHYMIYWPIIMYAAISKFLFCNTLCLVYLQAANLSYGYFSDIQPNKSISCAFLVPRLSNILILVFDMTDHKTASDCSNKVSLMKWWI
jgi:hypothetical protein